MLIRTGGPTEQTTQQAIQVTVEQAPKNWGYDILAGLIIALLVGVIIRAYTKRK